MEATTITKTKTLEDNVFRTRSLWLQVGIPIEHGGWSLTLEPIIAGLLFSWSMPGLLLGVLGILAFLARTPIKVVLVDMWRSRWLRRTKYALALALLETSGIVTLMIIVVMNTSKADFIVPLLVAIPLIGIQLIYDMRSKSRRLMPEIAGTIGISSLVAAIILVGGGQTNVAVGVWLILACRALAAICFVRVQMFRFRKKVCSLWHSDVAQVTALCVLAGAYFTGFVSLPAFCAIGIIAAINIYMVRKPVIKMTTVGFQQMGSGIFVILATLAGKYF